MDEDDELPFQNITWPILALFIVACGVVLWMIATTDTKTMFMFRERAEQSETATP